MTGADEVATDEVLDAVLDGEAELETDEVDMVELGSVEAVGDDVAASFDVTGTGGKRVAATLSGSGMVPVISLNSVHSSPL